MRRGTRLFELIQLLRAASAPRTAESLAQALEVSERTVYRDVAALQAMGTPIEGAAGIGYVLRRGYDLPPLAFDTEEIEALTVGLAMLARTGDSGLQRAAQRIFAKIEALGSVETALHVARWGANSDDPPECIDKRMLREAVRDGRKLSLLYRDGDACETRRTVCPVALIYHIDCVLLAAWCELRGDFRHFRTDRIWAWSVLEAGFDAAPLRSAWAARENTGRYARLEGL
ncbi:MAG: YafY family protein [Pseudomonadota bacterium]